MVHGGGEAEEGGKEGAGELTASLFLVALQSI
jgi:hypothetical protein